MLFKDKLPMKISLSNFITNLKSFHSYMWSKKVGCPSIGPLACNDGFTSNPEEMARIFSAAFTSVFTNPSGLPQSPHPLYDGTFSEIKLTMSAVTNALNDTVRLYLLIRPSSALLVDISVVQRDIHQYSHSSCC